MDYRARRDLIWNALDGAEGVTKALERLSMECDGEEASKLWADALLLWEGVIKLSSTHTRRPFDGDIKSALNPL
jgi:hypothetical protein